MINGPRVGFRINFGTTFNVNSTGGHATSQANVAAGKLISSPILTAWNMLFTLFGWDGTSLRYGAYSSAYDYTPASLPFDIWIEHDFRSNRPRVVDGSGNVITVGFYLEQATSARVWQGNYNVFYAQASCPKSMDASYPNAGQIGFDVELLGVAGGWGMEWSATDETTDWIETGTPIYASRTASKWTDLWKGWAGGSANVRSRTVAVRSPFPLLPLATPDGVVVAAQDRYGSGTALNESSITMERVVALVGADAVTERSRLATADSGLYTWWMRNGLLFNPGVQSADSGQTWQTLSGTPWLAPGAPYREGLGRSAFAAPPLPGQSGPGSSGHNQDATSAMLNYYRRTWPPAAADETYAVCEVGDLFASWPAEGASNLPLYSTFLPTGILEWGAFADGRQQIYRSRDGGTTWTKDADEATTNAAGLVAVDYWRSPSGIEALVGYDVDAEGIYVTQRTGGDLWDDWALATDVITAPCWPTIFQDTAGRWRIVAFVDRAWRMFQANWPSETWTEVTP